MILSLCYLFCRDRKLFVSYQKLGLRQYMYSRSSEPSFLYSTRRFSRRKDACFSGGPRHRSRSFHVSPWSVLGDTVQGTYLKCKAQPKCLACKEAGLSFNHKASGPLCKAHVCRGRPRGFAVRSVSVPPPRQAIMEVMLSATQ